jgi:hypothetical protein
MKSYLGIFIFQMIFYFVKSSQHPIEEYNNFLRGYVAENDTSVILKEESPNKREELKPIRCFWLESNSFSVFDLKNLKRPFNNRQ